MSELKRGFKQVTVYVSDRGVTPEDYLHLPVVKGGEPIGVVSHAVSEDAKGIKLTLTLWVKVRYENDKPCAIVWELGNQGE